MQINLEDTDSVDLNWSPLIDCIFLLLIFFLVGTTLKKPEEEIKVDLPEPALSAGRTESHSPVTIGIDSKGVFHLGANPVGQSDVREKLREIAANDPARHVKINVDRNAPSQYLVQVLDICVFEGLSNYGIHTKSKQRTYK